MDNMNSIGGYRSVYMAFGVFKTGSAEAKTTGDSNETPEFLTALGVASNKASGTDATQDDSADRISSFRNVNPYGSGAYLSYTRIITANLPADISSAMENGTASSPFDIKGEGQELQITIKVSVGSRIYTASGTDKNGNSFSKEIDPYNVDPTDTDYAGFATLCAYIRDTEGMADSAMQAVKDAMPEDITENGNFLLKVSYTSQGAGNLSGAKKLFEQMQSFFEKIMNLTGETSASANSDSGLVSVRSNSTGNSSYLSNDRYGRIMDELQEMIQLMIKQMLDEILGVSESEADINADESTEKVESVAQTNIDTNEDNAEPAAQHTLESTETNSTSVAQTGAEENTTNASTAAQSAVGTDDAITAITGQSSIVVDETDSSDTEALEEDLNIQSAVAL